MTQERSSGADLPAVRLHAAFKTVTRPLVDALVAMRVSASTVTGCALVAGGAAGIALAQGDFGWATFGLLIACVGDGLDGRVARRTRTASTAGALFDASADRYQEAFALGGLAVLFRTSAPVLELALVALVGSFMVSYGSAKAEAAGVSVPTGWMRRPERAAVLWIGVALTAAKRPAIPGSGLRAWTECWPVVIAIGLVAVASNLSAIRRLRAVALAAGAQRASRLGIGSTLATPPALRWRLAREPGKSAAGASNEVHRIDAS